MTTISYIEVQTLRQRGMKWAAIAAALGVKTSTLRAWATRHRLTKKWKAPGARSTNPLTFESAPPAPPTLDELFAAARENVRILNAVDPITNHETVSWPTGPVAVLFTSCAHLGSRYTFYERFLDIFRQALDTDGLYWLSLGDDTEGFLPGFVDAAAVAEQAFAHPKVQRQMLAGVLDKLADRGKLLAGCSSQHGGGWTRKKVGDDPIKDLYLARGVPYFDGKSLLTLKVARQTYQIALSHYFPGSSLYNPTHPQRRAALFEFPSADVVVMGHKHTYAVTELSLPPHEFDAGLRAAYTQWLVQVGTAKTGPDHYSMEGWARGVFEWPILVFRPDRHAIAATRDLAVARLFLKEWT